MYDPTKKEMASVVYRDEEPLLQRSQIIQFCERFFTFIRARATVYVPRCFLPALFTVSKSYLRNVLAGTHCLIPATMKPLIDATHLAASVNVRVQRVQH